MQIFGNEGIRFGVCGNLLLLLRLFYLRNMNNPKDKKQWIQQGNEKTGNRQESRRFNDDPVVFVPAENIRAIEQVTDNWEVVKQR